VAYYTNLINAWNSATQPPTGVTGTGLTGLTTANKLIAINGWTVIGTATKAILSPSAILNAIVFSDLAALTQLQVSQLTLLLAGSSVDASVGTSIRAGIQALFAGKTQTLTNLGALVAPFDSPAVPWWQASSGGGLNGPISQPDLTAAGGLT
jgi:hypothetical protein